MERRGARKLGDRKGKEQANPAEKQRARVTEKERERGKVSEVGDTLGKRYKNREKWRNAEGERGRPGRRIKGSGRGKRRARKTRSRAGQKE